jgi:hypothetical protein
VQGTDGRTGNNDVCLCEKILFLMRNLFDSLYPFRGEWSVDVVNARGSVGFGMP